MTWDPNLPTGTTPFSQVPGILTDNFNALEDGVVPYQKIHLADLGGDPTPVSGFGDAYTKLSGSYVEFFYENDNSNIVQLTSEGKIGTTSTNYLADTISFDGVNTYNENNMIVARADISAAGAATNTLNISSSSKSGANIYTINVAADVLSTANYQVMLTLRGSPGARIVPTVVTKPAPVASTVTAITTAIIASGGSLTTNNFSILVIGF